MRDSVFGGLVAEIRTIRAARRFGRVTGVGRGVLSVSGLSAAAGDRVTVLAAPGARVGGEVIEVTQDNIIVLPESPLDGFRIGDRVLLDGALTIAPDDSWLGRVVDPLGNPMDDAPLLPGPSPRPLRTAPPAPARRRPLGPRLSTGVAVFNTMLPIVRGQRIGLFAGSGVGKTSLLGTLAKGVSADVVVIALIGERGRELREFVEHVLGPEGMKRAVLVVATSDQSPLLRRQAAWTAIAVAEHFRDSGRHVLLVADSVTRFAEAHREVALAAGEAPSLRGYPPSVAHMIMSLAERAGPGEATAGDITAIFTVLVAGSDMEGPVADILRGVLDGHVVLDRAIAERGRYPAIDLLRSVSRSLPAAATDEENALISEARHTLSIYHAAEMMIQAGLYTAGSNPEIDRAVALWPKLDAFLAEGETGDVSDSFQRLGRYLGRLP
ncbi:FliI/YscN family ATPase [Halodurantibacterium flavum]|uniref:FliI/YscN family ATPase n=1 Tax=Halodurantibacterium flavum TaxID=1382802 RepID=A0ABW4S9I9_9RHOB